MQSSSRASASANVTSQQNGVLAYRQTPFPVALNAGMQRFILVPLHGAQRHTVFLAFATLPRIRDDGTTMLQPPATNAREDTVSRGKQTWNICGPAQNHAPVSYCSLRPHATDLVSGAAVFSLHLLQEAPSLKHPRYLCCDSSPSFRPFQSPTYTA